MVPEDEAVYPELTARRFVSLRAALSGVDDVRAAAARAIETVELTDAADRELGGFSKGMRQRAKVAAALVGDPEVLILDEPLNGADPVQRAQLIDLFVRLGGEGRIVIVSSHVLAEVERMTHRVLAMVDGRLAATGDLADLRAAMTDKPRRVRILTDRPRDLAAALVRVDGVTGVDLDGASIDIGTADPTTLAIAIPALAGRQRIRVTGITPEDESLESVFRYLMERGS
jgi:ABC-2 type transport system ATP-binding protein